jgi:hypothetical protein
LLEWKSNPCSARIHLPSQGSHVRKRNTTEKSEATSNEASKSGRVGSLGGHAARLKIESRKITKPKNKNGAPVPEGETKQNPLDDSSQMKLTPTQVN